MKELSGRIIGKLRNKSDEAVTSLEFVAAEIEEAADREMMIPCLSLFKWLKYFSICISTSFSSTSLCRLRLSKAREPKVE